MAKKKRKKPVVHRKSAPTYKEYINKYKKNIKKKFKITSTKPVKKNTVKKAQVVASTTVSTETVPPKKRRKFFKDNEIFTLLFFKDDVIRPKKVVISRSILLGLVSVLTLCAIYFGSINLFIRSYERKINATLQTITTLKESNNSQAEQITELDESIKKLEEQLSKNKATLDNLKKSAGIK